MAFHPLCCLTTLNSLKDPASESEEHNCAITYYRCLVTYCVWLKRHHSKMFKLIFLFCFCVTVTFAMDCSLDSDRFEKIFTSCPRILIDSSDEKYCCPTGDGSVKCCDLQAFVFQWFLMIWPILLLVLLVAAILSCICCCLRHMHIC